MDQNTISTLQQLWWLGLIPAVIAVVIHLWHRHYQKTHVESQFIITGCTMGTIILIYYIVCIIAACFSILGFFLRLFH